ncbi:MAG: HAMP domain-containing sensor histidine kinase [Kofleriaceae bacterium]
MRVWPIALLATCVGAPIALALVELSRDRDAALDAFAADKLADLTESAQDLAGNLQRVGDDLTLAAELPDHGDAALGAIASVKRAYPVIDVKDATGQRRHVATSPKLASDAAVVIDRMFEAAAAAPNELHISSGLSTRDDEAAWYRVFARQTLDGKAAAAVVDMREVVIPPRLLHTGSQRLLVLSAHGVPAPISDPGMMKLTDPVLTSLVARAVARQPGTERLSARSAEELGLPHSDAIAAVVPLPIDKGQPWVLALVASAQSLDARHAALTRRLVFGGIGGLALLALATAYVVRVSRREQELRERLRAEARLLRSEKLATAGQLSAGIAHEIGTPLGVMRGRAEMAMTRLGSDHAEAPGLKVIVDQADHVTHLIQQLLSYARPDATRARQIELRTMIDSVVELLATEARRKHVTLHRNECSGRVFADSGQLQQVLVNVLMNAIDACDDNGRVTIGATAVDSTIAISVADTGCGISDEDRPHLFDPFFTRKKRGKGTGLGLWVVAEIARAHKTEIEIESELGRGTTFRLLWPVENQA